MKRISIISLLFVIIIMSACTSAKKQQSVADAYREGTLPQGYKTELSEYPVRAIGGQSNYMPKAVIYQTNGRYNKHVMINLNKERNQVISYPAISDVSADSEPIELGNGWLLDRRGGIGPNSVFVQYTYPEYAALKSQPSARELFEKIIPGSMVTRFIVLPITANEAIDNPESVKVYIPEN